MFDLKSLTSPEGATTVIYLLIAFIVVDKCIQFNVMYWIGWQLEFLFHSVRPMEVEMTDTERLENLDTEPSTSVKIDGKRGQIQCFDPSTKQFLGSVPAMNASDVHELLVKAKVAQQKWAQTTFTQRRAVLRTLQQYICAHVEDICRVCTRDSGKPKVDALLGEVLTTCEKIRTTLNWGERWLEADSSRPTGPLMLHKTATVEYVPLGIVAPIAPWNYPFHNYINHIISGIFAGNAVVGKVSEHTSWSAAYFGRMVQQALRVHGHDINLCATVTGYGDAGAALVQDPLVDKVIFTGSPGIGKRVMETASHSLKPVILELGGKDAMVVMDDVKIDNVVPWIMRGCFQNCGQNCVGIERVLVYESVHDELVDKLTPLVKNLRQGIPLATCGSTAEVDVGSMVMGAQLDMIQELVDDAVKQGATLVTGGQRASNLSGQFYQPTILTNVTPKMRIFQQEVFGPVMTIAKVPNDSDEDCLEMANSTAFGLGSSVYCGNAKRGLKLGRQIRSGMCCINDFGSNYLVQSLPFGGVGESGFGRFGGIEGLRAMCLERSILTDRIPGVRTNIPPPINYPIDKKKGLPFAESLIQLFYNESMWGKIKGIVGLIKFG